MGTQSILQEFAASKPVNQARRVAAVPKRQPVAIPVQDVDEVATGIAISTGDDKALLREHRKELMQRASTSEKPNFHPEETCTGGAVVGVPIKSRNYMALLQGLPTAEQPSQVPTKEQPNQMLVKEVEPEEKDADIDGLAVLGLPIDTHNYNLAMLESKEEVNIHDEVIKEPTQEPEENIRKARFSDLPERRVDCRVSAPALVGVPMGKATPLSKEDLTYATGPDTRNKRRPSCFDLGRRSGSGVKTYTGWLYVRGGSSLQKWKKQYIVLAGLNFKYSSGVGCAPKEVGMLQNFRQWGDMHLGLVFELTSDKSVFCYAENEEEYKKWVNAVQSELDRVNPSRESLRASYSMPEQHGLQHEGPLLKQRSNGKCWTKFHFILRANGYLSYRNEKSTNEEPKGCGIIKSVAFADIHPHALAIQLRSGTMMIQAESYDERMLWYTAISAAINQNTGAVVKPSSSIKSSYVQTMIPNFSGWVYKQVGLFKSPKRLYMTLHGDEVCLSKDHNSSIMLVDRAHSIEEWNGKPNGLAIRLKSGRIWKVYAESYENAKHWRALIDEAIRHVDRINVKRYLASREKKELPPVFGGWLTLDRGSTKLRRYYVLSGRTLGLADDVDIELETIGTVVDVGASPTIACGIVISLSNGKRLDLSPDSVDTRHTWYECLSAVLQ